MKRVFLFTSLIIGSLLIITPARAPAPAAPQALACAMHFAVIGDYGQGSDPEEGEVAALVHSWNPEFIISTGDNNYDNGAAATIDANIGQYYQDYIYPYYGSYGPGSPTGANRFWPVLGNHDWDTANAQPYLNYFTLPGNERYYTLTVGSGLIEFFMLDSDGQEPDGNEVNSVQAQWLQTRLAASTARWKIVVLHHSPFSSGRYGSSAWLQWPFKDWGADLVLTGHNHAYERILKNGFPYLVNGSGGKSLYPMEVPEPGMVMYYGLDYGAQHVTATPNALTFTFIRRTGQVIDTYTLTKPGASSCPQLYLPIIRR